jgi:hypothetical protein
MKTQFSSRLLVVFTVLALACDSLDSELDAGQGDESQRTVRLMTAADRSTLLDVKQIFRSVKGVDLAKCGASHVNYVNDRYVRYSDVVARAADFSFGVLHTNNSRTDVDVVLTRQEAAFTHAKMRSNEVLVVNLLNNPELGSYDPFLKSTITVDSNRPGDTYFNTKNVVFEVSTIEGVGNLVTMRYAPPAGFVGQVKFRYYVIVDVESGLAPCNLPEASEYYSAHDVVIEVAP